MEDNMPNPNETIKFKDEVIRKLPRLDLQWLQGDTQKKLDMLKIVSQASIMASILGDKLENFGDDAMVSSFSDFAAASLVADIASDATRSAFLSANLTKDAVAKGGVNPFDMVNTACTTAAIIGIVVGSGAPDEVVGWADAELANMADGGDDYSEFLKEIDSIASGDACPEDEE